ncbi:MAG TPA: MFS transporter [Usitatibacter sp.]|nr:MFS transporter [Usitatibacter sp.]
MKALALLWLAGACLRLTLLAIPPVIPQIHAAFSLSQAAIGALTSLPVLLFSFAAIPGSLLITRMGAARVLTLGLFVTAAGGALRGLSTDAATLFASTFAMGVGIAIMQPALPSVVREWTPHRVALGIATYSNGLLVGEAISASLTIPFVLPLVHGNWRASLAAWSIPVFVVAVMSLRPPGSREPKRGNAADPRRWWPDWHDPLTWGSGLLAGYASSLYYATNAFLPGLLAARGRPELLNATLAALNWMQLPASFLMLAYGRKLTMRRGPFVVLNALSVAAIGGLVLMPGSAIVAWSGVIGFCNAFLLILTLAMPPLMAKPEDVPRLSAAMFLIGYLCAFVIPIIGGAAWDATHAAAAAFVPLGIFGLLTLGVAARLDFRRGAVR